MHDRDQASEIDDVATAWAAKAERGLSTAERADLNLWLEGDSRRLGAYVRAQAAWIHAERAAALGMMPEPIGKSAEQPVGDYTDVSNVKREGVSRRVMLGGGGALAASMAAAYYLGTDRYRTIESGVGEVRQIALSSGAALTLDTDSQVDIALSSSDMRLKLVRGRIFLDVTRKQASPLTVDIGDLVLVTASAAFSLKNLLGAPLVALVTRGTLLASQSQGLLTKPHKVTIASGHALTLASDELVRSSDVRAVASAEQDQLLAWRDGMLSFSGEVLADAVRAFDRYSAIRIEVSDPALARQRVTGLFKASDPQGFATAIAVSLGGVATESGNVIRIAAKNLPAA